MSSLESVKNEWNECFVKCIDHQKKVATAVSDRRKYGLTVTFYVILWQQLTKNDNHLKKFRTKINIFFDFLSRT